jgi:predicted RNase H-like HicB family nuclease
MLNLNYYMRLKWTYTIEQDSHEGNDFYIIRINELPGVCTDAESVEEGMQEIKEPLKAAIKLYMSNGEEIPEPIREEDYPGKIAYRTSSRRHCKLAKEAKRRKKSLSKLLDDLIDQSL